MKYKFYKSSSLAWSAMLDATRQATKYIYWEVYIFQDDTDPAFNFFDVLIEKAKEGVKVVMILDAFGSMYLSSETVEKLNEAGVEVLFFKKLLRRVHRKILIVDGKVAFLGGVNIGQLYVKWPDLQLKITHKSVIKSLLWTFSRSYILCGGKDKSLEKIRDSSPSRKTKIWFIDHFPSIGKFLLREYYQEKIARARKSIIIVSPYFVPRPWLLRILKDAMDRGVSIEIVVPEKTDSDFMNFANMIFIRLASQIGIKFYLGKEMNHAKAMLIDGKEGLVGSNNLDSQSFIFNTEASVSFVRKDMVRDLKNIVYGWRDESKLFNIEDYPSKWYFRPVEWIVRLISPVL